MSSSPLNFLSIVVVLDTLSRKASVPVRNTSKHRKLRQTQFVNRCRVWPVCSNIPQLRGYKGPSQSERTNHLSFLNISLQSVSVLGLASTFKMLTTHVKVQPCPPPTVLSSLLQVDASTRPSWSKRLCSTSTAASHPASLLSPATLPPYTTLTSRP